MATQVLHKPQGGEERIEEKRSRDVLSSPPLLSRWRCCLNFPSPGSLPLLAHTLQQAPHSPIQLLLQQPCFPLFSSPPCSVDDSSSTCFLIQTKSLSVEGEPPGDRDSAGQGGGGAGEDRGGERRPRLQGEARQEQVSPRTNGSVVVKVRRGAEGGGGSSVKGRRQ